MSLLPTSMKLLTALIVVLSLPAYSKILKEFDTSILAPGDRINRFFSDYALDAFYIGYEKYKIILDKEGDSVDEILSELSPFFKKYDYVLPKNVEVADLTPLVQDMFPMINLDIAAGVPKSFNCLNATLLTQGFLKRQSYTSAEEFEFYTEHFCKEISHPAAGSISYYPNRSVQHSRLNITSELSFEKPSNHKTKAYRLNFRPSSKGLIHYNCNTQKFEAITCRELDYITSKVDQIDEYYYQFSAKLKDTHLRSLNEENIDVLMNSLESYKGHNTNCETKKNILYLRLESLRGLSNIIRVEGVNGDYDGLISPKF